MNTNNFASHPIMIPSALLFPPACMLPVVANLFESGMLSHMLVQLPLLIICGIIIGQLPQVHRIFRAIDPTGYASAIFASGWLIFWMLPLNLDAAQESFDFRLLKTAIVPEARKVLKHMQHVWGKERATRKYLYQLFPYGYGQQACKIAGMRKPLKLMLDV